MRATNYLFRPLLASFMLLGGLAITAGVWPRAAIDAATRGQPPSTQLVAQNPSLSSPTTSRSSGSLAVLVSGRQGRPAGNLDLYFFAAGSLVRGSSATASTFIGRRYAAAHNTGTFSATVFARRVAKYCSPAISIVAINRSSYLASNLQTVTLPCGWKLNMHGVPGSPSLEAAAANAIITVWGSSYSLDTAVHLYLFNDGLPYGAPVATVAQGNTLQRTSLQAQASSRSRGNNWTVLAVDDTAHRASPQLAFHFCGPEECSGIADY